MTKNSADNAAPVTLGESGDGKVLAGTNMVEDVAMKAGGNWHCGNGCEQLVDSARQFDTAIEARAPEGPLVVRCGVGELQAHLRKKIRSMF